MIVKDIDPSLVPSMQALNQMSPVAQQAVVALVKQLAQTEGIAVASTLAPGLQAPAEGSGLWVTHLLALGFAPRSVELYRNNAQKYLEHDPSPTRLSIQAYIARRLEEVSPARVSEGGLQRLNELKRELGVGWDNLILDAVSEKYGVPVEELALPKAEMKAEGSEAGETKKGED